MAKKTIILPSLEDAKTLITSGSLVVENEDGTTTTLNYDDDVLYLVEEAKDVSSSIVWDAGCNVQKQLLYKIGNMVCFYAYVKFTSNIGTGTFMTLPIGYRPETQVRLPCIKSSHALINIDTSGNITFTSSYSISTGQEAWLSLMFKTA